MSDQNLVHNWIQQTVANFGLRSVRHASKSLSAADCASCTYKWPLETGNGLIRFFYDKDTLLSVFSITFKKSFGHFNLPDLRGAYDTVLYFDEVTSCFLNDVTVSITPPDSDFSKANEDKYQTITPHTFYLKTGEQFGSMRCLSDASASGICLISKDESLMPPDQFSGVRVYSSKNQYALKAMITDLLHYPYENTAAQFFFKGKIQEFLSYLIFEREKDQTSLTDSDKNPVSISQGRKSDVDNIRHVMEYIRSNLNVNLSGDEVVQVSHMSLAKLKYTFKDLTGMTMTEYKANVQIKKACQLLWSTDMKVSQIADICGYQGTTSFGAAFKKKMGISPLQYRRKA